MKLLFVQQFLSHKRNKDYLKVVLQQNFTYVLHFLGIMYPSKPGFSDKFGIILLQDLHWIEIFVALALIPDALITIPGILTKCETTSDWKN